MDEERRGAVPGRFRRCPLHHNVIYARHQELFFPVNDVVEWPPPGPCGHIIFQRVVRPSKRCRLGGRCRASVGKGVPGIEAYSNNKLPLGLFYIVWRPSIDILLGTLRTQDGESRKISHYIFYYYFKYYDGWLLFYISHYSASTGLASGYIFAQDFAAIMAVVHFYFLPCRAVLGTGYDTGNVGNRREKGDYLKLFFRKTPYRKSSLLLGILLFLSISLPVHFLITLPMISPISIKNGTYGISDFCYWILVVKSFWLGETNSIYTLESNLRAMSSFFGQEIKYAMPIGVSPTALLIWLPFSYVAIYSLSLANTAWVSFSLTVFSMSIIIARRTLYSLNPYFSNIFLLVTSLFFLSFEFQTCIFKGNTSVLASGIFILLILTLYSQTNTNFIKKFVLILFYLIILSIKTTYLIIALILLLIFGYILEYILSS